MQCEPQKRWRQYVRDRNSVKSTLVTLLLVTYLDLVSSVSCGTVADGIPPSLASLLASFQSVNMSCSYSKTSLCQVLCGLPFLLLSASILVHKYVYLSAHDMAILHSCCPHHFIIHCYLLCDVRQSEFLTIEF